MVLRLPVTNVRPRLRGTVRIYDAVDGSLIATYKNSISSITPFIQYAQTGGVISDYAYTLTVEQGGNIVQYTSGGLVYVPSSSGFTARFTFYVSPVQQGDYTLTLSIVSTYPLNNFASVGNVSLPSSKSFFVVWDIDVTTSLSDFFTPYLIIALFGPTQYTTLPPNAQYAFQQVSSGNYLTTPPSYYVTYNGTKVPVSPTFTQDSIYINYVYVPQTYGVMYNLGIVATGVNGYINLVMPLSSTSLTVGQYIAFAYNAVWSYS